MGIGISCSYTVCGSDPCAPHAGQQEDGCAAPVQRPDLRHGRLLHSMWVGVVAVGFRERGCSTVGLGIALGASVGRQTDAMGAYSTACGLSHVGSQESGPWGARPGTGCCRRGTVVGSGGAVALLGCGQPCLDQSQRGRAVRTARMVMGRQGLCWGRFGPAGRVGGAGRLGQRRGTRSGAGKGQHLAAAPAPVAPVLPQSSHLQSDFLGRVWQHIRCAAYG